MYIIQIVQNFEIEKHIVLPVHSGIKKINKIDFQTPQIPVNKNQSPN
jgi:hypothetical protein